MATTPCFPAQVSRDALDKALTPERVAGIWKYTHTNYIDKGVPFEQAITSVAHDLNMRRDWVAMALDKPKTLRILNNEMYRKQEQRRMALRQARLHVEFINSPIALRAFVAATAIPRRVLTFGHGVVFPVTHALDLAGSEWTAYGRLTKNSWKYLSKSEHARAMDALRNDPEYAWARQSGLVIDPEQGPQGILSGGVGKTSWSRRAWDALKVTRLELFKDRWNDVPMAERNKAIAKDISSQINHATGVMSPGEWGFGAISKGMFAPQLTASKIAKSTVDPYKTGKTALQIATQGKESVPFNERHIAALRARKAGTYLASYVGFLAVNQGLIKAGLLGDDKTKINFLNPMRADWLRPAAFGHTLNTRGSMELIRLAGNIVAISQADRKALHGDTRTEASRGAVAKYAEYKMDPFLQNVREAMTGEDVFGRPMPWTSTPSTSSKQRYSWTELAMSKGPIWFGGATREIYDSLRERGMKPTDAMSIIRGLEQNSDVIGQGLAVGAMEAIGGGISKIREPKPDRQTTSFQAPKFKPPSFAPAHH